MSSFTKLPNVIGLYSPAPKMGKSCVVKYVMSEIAPMLGYNIVNIKISAPLKDPLYKLGLTERHIEGDLKDVPCPELSGMTPRNKMIELFEAGCKRMNSRAWLSLVAAQEIFKALEKGQNVLVDDVRNPSDYEMIRAFNEPDNFVRAEVWRLYRPQALASSDDGKLEGQLEEHSFHANFLNDTEEVRFLHRLIDKHLGVF